jgi:metal-responsive CopG/Arc/MetJ family transcriptional regulator
MIKDLDDFFIVKCISDGYSVGSISILTNISERTIEGRLIKIRAEYKAKTLAHLVAIFFKKNILEI